MSTMRVTMTRTTMGETGSLLTAGSTYAVSTAFGAYLVGQAKAATDPDGALSPLGSEPLRLATNPVTGAASAVSGDENFPVKELRTSMARNRITERGSDLINTTISTGWTRSGSGTAYSVSSLYSRRSAHTMLVDMTSASADAIIEWSNATGVAADPTDQLLAFDVYIPEIVQANVGGTISMSIFVSNATSYAAPGTAWVVNSNYLRQGWNQITLCGLDADGALNGDRGTGTLPFGMSKTGASAGASPLNWSNPIKFIQILFTYTSANKRKFYLDSQIRIPAKIRPFVCVGFDSSGASLTDDEFTNNTAPFLQGLGIPSYFTMTQVYDAIYMGTQDDTRRETLYGTYGWDAINHSWSHGASVPGALYASGNSLVVSGTGTLATLTLSGAHGWTIGTKVLIAVIGATGASSTNANGVFEATVTTTTALTYVITGGTDGTATGTVKASTYLNDVFNTVAVTNQPIILGASNALAALKHEFVDINYYGRMKGWLRGSRFMAYPNNSYPDMRIMETVADLAGIKLARGLAGTTVRVGEFGVDNPLALGSIELKSGSAGSTYADIVNAVQGAINRGQGICIFGHFLRDESLDAVVDPDSPPGKNGNPAAPGTSTTLWWYRVTFRKLMTYLATLEAAGQLDFVSADELVNQLAD